MDTKVVTDVIQEELESFLGAAGRDAEEAKNAMAGFLAEIQPEIENALVAGDTMSLNLLRDMAAARAGRTAITLTFAEQQAVSSTISSIVRAAIKFGIAAALA